MMLQLQKSRDIFLYSLDILVDSADVTSNTLRYMNSLIHNIHLELLGEICSAFHAAKAIHTKLIFVPPGTHYY